MCFCAPVLLCLSASTVTRRVQKDLPRISGGLDTYFSFFCRLGCVPAAWTGLSHWAAYPVIYTGSAERCKNLLFSVTHQTGYLLNISNWYMTSWWLQKGTFILVWQSCFSFESQPLIAYFSASIKHLCPLWRPCFHSNKHLVCVCSSVYIYECVQCHLLLVVMYSTKFY